jgi:hypothetical protein
MKRLKQAVQRLRMRPAGRGALFHGGDQAVAVVGEHRHDHAGDRRVDAVQIGNLHLDGDLAALSAGRRQHQEHK